MDSNSFRRLTIDGFQLVMRRTFNATPVRVYEAWTKPSEVVKWWGPKGFTAPVCKVDLRVGGEYLYCTRSPEGTDYWSKGVFQEILPANRIVATDSFCDAYGNIIDASAVGLPLNWPSTLLITVTFQKIAHGTRFILIHSGLPPEMIESCKAGWGKHSTNWKVFFNSKEVGSDFRAAFGGTWVEMTQDKNVDEAALENSEQNWKMVLGGLKK